MFDYTILDGRTFGELGRALDLILEKINKLEEEVGEGEDNPAIDAFYAVADNIIRRMDSVVREHARDNPELSAQWDEQMRDYQARYDRYTDYILEDDSLLILDESPEDS